MPRAQSLLGCVLVCFDRFGFDEFQSESMLCVVMPLMGRPAFLFIGQGKAWVIREGKEKNEKEKKSSRITGSFSFTRVPLTL